MNKFSKALHKAAKKRPAPLTTARKPVERIEPDVNQEQRDIQYALEKKQLVRPQSQITIEAHKIDPHIISFHDPRSRISEQYRVLRTNLKSLQKKSCKTIVISSSIEGEGKTITSLNLAFTLAQDNTKKVLVIDADLRRSKVGHYVNLDEEMFGLVDVLEGTVAFDAILVGTPLDNLHILPGNRSREVEHAAELLGSQDMKKILAYTRDEYDYVIVDSPPIIPVTDASVIGVNCDGVLLAVQAARTPRNTVLHAQNLFEQAKVTLLGYVLTSIEYISPGYKDYYYYNYN